GGSSRRRWPRWCRACWWRRPTSPSCRWAGTGGATPPRWARRRSSPCRRAPRGAWPRCSAPRWRRRSGSGCGRGPGCPSRRGGRRARARGAAARLPLVAVRLARLLSVALANGGGGAGAAVLYSYAWALFTLPYGVSAVPIATSAFTALAVRHGEGDAAGFAAVLAAGARVCAVVTAALAAALAAAAGPVAELLAAADPEPLARALPVYALGIVGFGLVALF